MSLLLGLFLVASALVVTAGVIAVGLMASTPQHYHVVIGGDVTVNTAAPSAPQQSVGEYLESQFAALDQARPL